ncbi:MAG: metal-dependent transcriptional regulator, partial [Bacteroidota bacterium]
GVLSAFIGFLLAVIFETTPGPAMAITATLLYLAAVCFAPERGLLVRYFRRRHLHRKIRWEDTLKQAYRLQQKGKLTMDNLASQLDFSKKSLQLHLNYLHGSKYLFKNEMRLTPQGEAQANRLIRAHRLWETYLVEQMGLTTEQIHEDAEKYEHLLTDELLDEMDKELGFPALDPHGSPIPTKIGLPNFPLSRLDVLAKARIAAQQTSDHIATQLWQLGLLPGMDLIVRKKENGVLVIQQNEQLIRVSTDLARQINIELAEQ